MGTPITHDTIGIINNFDWILCPITADQSPIGSSVRRATANQPDARDYTTTQYERKFVKKVIITPEEDSRLSVDT